MFWLLLFCKEAFSLLLLSQKALSSFFFFFFFTFLFQNHLHHINKTSFIPWIMLLWSIVRTYSRINHKNYAHLDSYKREGGHLFLREINFFHKGVAVTAPLCKRLPLTLRDCEDCLPLTKRGGHLSKWRLPFIERGVPSQ